MSRQPAPACDECTITYELTAEIGKSEDPWSIRSKIRARVFKRSSAEYLVYELGTPTLARYDSRGDFLGFVTGAGSGPGEFRGIWAVGVDATDSLYVYDDFLRRMTVFTPRLEHARTIPFPHSVVWFIPHDGGFVVHGHEPDSLRGRHRLHLISKGGEYLQPLDSPGTHHGRSIGNSSASRSATLHRSQLLTLRKDTPTITLYELPAGQLRSTTRLNPPWYPGPEIPVKRYVPEDPFHVPQNVAQRPAWGIMDIALNDDGSVWTLAWQEAPGWESVEPPFGAVPPRGVLNNLERYWVGHVDVIDPVTWETTASLTLPFLALAFVGGLEIATIVERADDGLIVIELYRLRLERPHE